MSNLSGIIGSGQTDGRTHPLGGVLVHVLSIVRVPQDSDFFQTHGPLRMVPRGDHGTTKDPAWCVGTGTRQAGPRLRGTASPRWITRKVYHSLPPALDRKPNPRRPFLPLYFPSSFDLATPSLCRSNITSRRRRINPHREDSKAHAFLFQPVDDRHQVGYGSGQPADFGDDQRIPRPGEGDSLFQSDSGSKGAGLLLP